jgi:hypothetical protein
MQFDHREGYGVFEFDGRIVGLEAPVAIPSPMRLQWKAASILPPAK